jgi:hypothetical protein
MRRLVWLSENRHELHDDRLVTIATVGDALTLGMAAAAVVLKVELTMRQCPAAQWP